MSLWLTENYSILIPLAAAVISAAVALIVAVLTQSALSRRTNREYRTRKLEEFYLVLNEYSAANVAKFITVKNSFNGKKRLDADEITSIHAATAELNGKMDMYIDLYFPLLLEPYQALLLKQSNLHHLIASMNTVTPPDLEQLRSALKDVGGCIHTIEQKIIQDRHALIKGQSNAIL